MRSSHILSAHADTMPDHTGTIFDYGLMPPPGDEIRDAAGSALTHFHFINLAPSSTSAIFLTHIGMILSCRALVPLMNRPMPGIGLARAIKIRFDAVKLLMVTAHFSMSTHGSRGR